jgi:hypothetical protein
MNKKSLTETDIRTKFITPALIGANGEKWDVMTQIREECYFPKGRVIVRGKTVKRGVAKKADYLLDFRPNLILAVLEAKDYITGDALLGFVNNTCCPSCGPSPVAATGFPRSSVPPSRTPTTT